MSSLLYNNCWGHQSGFIPLPSPLLHCGTGNNYAICNYENVVSEAKSISVAAYGLEPDEIIVKEIEGKLTVKSTPKVKTNVQSNLNLSYTLKNTRLDSITLMLGVLTLDFVDTENVVIHKVNS